MAFNFDGRWVVVAGAEKALTAIEIAQTPCASMVVSGSASSLRA
jgi:hypothetical protein